MPRLFRKFLAIIWLTVLGSVVAMAVILNAFQASPVTPQLEEQKRDIVLDLARTILIEDGEAAANRFVDTSEESLPLGLTVSRIPDGTTCTVEDTAETRTVLLNGDCYRVSVLPPEGIVPPRLAPALLGLAILLSSLLAAVLLARNVVNPVKRLRDGLHALAQGRFDVRIGDGLSARGDEMAGLAADFDRTARRLQEQRDAQQRLFHDVSHELRSPLSRLHAVTGILRKTPARLDPMLDRMDREVERLDTLVGEVLMLARLADRAQVPLQTQKLDVMEILNAILADAAFEAQPRDITVTTEVEGTFLAEVDGELIYRALENVIRNAVKYTAEGSRVSVICQATADLLRICVEDKGPGVPRDDLERIFQPFSRGSDTAHQGGYGLGLAIARQAVERHGGQVQADLPQGGGLRVTLELPRSPAARGDNRFLDLQPPDEGPR